MRHRDEIFCCTEYVPLWVSSLFVMSNMAFAFWGPFQALSHNSVSKPQETDMSTTHTHVITDTRIYTHTKVFAPGRSIRHQPLCRDWCSPAQNEKKNVLFSTVFLSVSFQHICPDIVQVTSPNGVKLRSWGQELSSGHKHPCFRTSTFFVFHCSAPVSLPQACRGRSHLAASYVAIFSGYSWAYY